jgi:hypothetical protein
MNCPERWDKPLLDVGAICRRRSSTACSRLRSCPREKRFASSLPSTCMASMSAPWIRCRRARSRSPTVLVGSLGGSSWRVAPPAHSCSQSIRTRKPDPASGGSLGGRGIDQIRSHAPLDGIRRGVPARGAFVDPPARPASDSGKRAEKMHGPIAQVALARRMRVAGVTVHSRQTSRARPWRHLVRTRTRCSRGIGNGARGRRSTRPLRQKVPTCLGHFSERWARSASSSHRRAISSNSALSLGLAVSCATRTHSKA